MTNREILRFGQFRFNPTTGELEENGERCPLAPTPAQLLRLLLVRPGEVVTRDEIWASVWPGEYLDLDQRLNFCVHQLRRSLGDDAADPHYIETVPRNGYRFLAPVHAEKRPWHSSSRPSGLLATLGETGKRRFVTAAWAIVILFSAVAVVLQLKHEETVPSEEAARSVELAEFVLANDPHDLDRATRFAQQAIQTDATFAPGYVTLAKIEQERGNWPSAASLLHTALEYDSGNADANHILGAHHLFQEWNLDAAQEHLERALLREPDNVVVHRLLSHVAIMRGDTKKAVAHADRAASLNVGHTTSQADAGWIYYWAGDYDRAVQACRESVDLVGANHWNQGCLLSAWIAQDNADSAAAIARTEMADAGLDVRNIVRPLHLLDEFYRWRLTTLDTIPGSAYAMARVQALLGREHEAIRMLRRAAAERHVGVLYARADPVFAELWTSEAFEQFTAAVFTVSQGRGQNPPRTGVDDRSISPARAQ